LHLLCRRLDLVISGGENVYPLEVEAALEGVPGLRAACVFGIPDERWGQIVAAGLVPTDPGAPPSDDLILGSLRDRLASYKWPKSIAFLDALPTDESGKPSRARAIELARPLLRGLLRSPPSG
jgi:O-succinylbenzoic acid--CoA ligase